MSQPVNASVFTTTDTTFATDVLQSPTSANGTTGNKRDVVILLNLDQPGQSQP